MKTSFELATDNPWEEKSLTLTPATESTYLKYGHTVPRQITRNNIFFFTPKPIAAIVQSELAYSSNKVRQIASSGAGPCVIVILYDRDKKQGWMAHVYAAAEISPLTPGGAWLLQECQRRYEGSRVDIFMIGGYSCLSELLIKSINHFVQALHYHNVSIMTVFKQLKENWASSVVFNFDSGEAFSYESCRNLSSGNLNKYLLSYQFLADGLVSTFKNVLPSSVAKLKVRHPDSEMAEFQKDYQPRRYHLDKPGQELVSDDTTVDIPDSLLPRF